MVPVSRLELRSKTRVPLICCCWLWHLISCRSGCRGLPSGFSSGFSSKGSANKDKICRYLMVLVQNQRTTDEQKMKFPLKTYDYRVMSFFMAAWPCAPYKLIYFVWHAMPSALGHWAGVRAGDASTGRCATGPCSISHLWRSAALHRYDV